MKKQTLRKIQKKVLWLTIFRYCIWALSKLSPVRLLVDSFLTETLPGQVLKSLLTGNASPWKDLVLVWHGFYTLFGLPALIALAANYIISRSVDLLTTPTGQRIVNTLLQPILKPIVRIYILHIDSEGYETVYDIARINRADTPYGTLSYRKRDQCVQLKPDNEAPITLGEEWMEMNDGGRLRVLIYNQVWAVTTCSKEVKRRRKMQYRKAKQY